MARRSQIRCLFLALFLSFAFVQSVAQSAIGELEVFVRGPSAAPVQGTVQIDDKNTGLHRSVSTGPEGRVTLRSVPFGWYTLTVSASGFETVQQSIQIKSLLSRQVTVGLHLETVKQDVSVASQSQSFQTDPQSRDYITDKQIQSLPRIQVGRAAVDVTASQPGWILEANGVLHPRGSEYQTLWLLDGIPVTDNRSAGFAPTPDVDTVQAMTVWTSGYPAEFGRKLGGVISTVPEPPQNGLDSSLLLAGGSFETGSVVGTMIYGGSHYSVGSSVDLGGTHRYLDPPSADNFHNSGAAGNGQLWASVDATPKDRLRLSLESASLFLQVPNTVEQEQLSQDQSRKMSEDAVRLWYQRIFGTSGMLNIRASVRDLKAGLDANASSIPIIPWQRRGIREGYTSVSTTWFKGRHEWSAGTDLLLQRLNERFRYQITDPSAFDSDVPPVFAFRDAATAVEPAAYLQDRITLPHFSVQAGLRWDGYRLRLKDQAWSPRLAVVWHSDRAKLSLHASYDRVFQTPAIENLLLSSSFATEHLTAQTAGTAVPPSHGDFFEIGLSKLLHSSARLDISWYDRRVDNFADDDVFLNSGVSFPIAFRRAHIYGIETKIRIISGKLFTAEFSYSNMVGRAQLPITGGLLLQDAHELLKSQAWSPITQDQRNTASLEARYQLRPSLWLATSQSFGSGLPFDDNSPVPPNSDIAQSIDVVRQKVRPFYELDLQAGVNIVTREKRSLTLEAAISNLFDSFHLINFSGLLSGTAIGLPRSYSLSLRLHTHN